MRPAAGKNEPAPGVFVIEDDPSIREMLSRVLEGAGLPVRAFADAEAFLAACGEEAAGCAIVDLHLPGMDGVALQAAMKEKGFALPVLFLTGRGTVSASVAALKAGAFDFLEKPVERARLLERVREALAADGERRARSLQRGQARARFARLTQREREVIELVALGASNKAIARRLQISHRTVEIHRVRAMRKLGARNALELAKLAVLCGFPASPGTQTLS